MYAYFDVLALRSRPTRSAATGRVLL